MKDIPFLLAATGFAADNAVPEGPEQFNVFATMLQVIVSLAFIIGLMLLLIKIFAHKNRSWMSGRTVRLLGGVPLGQNKSLQIAKVGRTIYLLGVGDNVQMIDKIEESAEVEHILDSFAAEHSGGSRYGAGMLGKWLGKLKNRGTDEEDDHPDLASSFQEIFHNKMKHTLSRKQIADEWLHEERRKDRLNGR